MQAACQLESAKLQTQSTWLLPAGRSKRPKFSGSTLIGLIAAYPKPFLKGQRYFICSFALFLVNSSAAALSWMSALMLWLNCLRTRSAIAVGRVMYGRSKSLQIARQYMARAESGKLWGWKWHLLQGRGLQLIQLTNSALLLLVVAGTFITVVKQQCIYGSCLQSGAGDYLLQKHLVKVLMALGVLILAQGSNVILLLPIMSARCAAKDSSCLSDLE